MSERLTSISISTAIRPATGASAVSTKPSIGSSRISNNILKAPKYDVVKPASLGGSHLNQNPFTDTKVLWQAKPDTPKTHIEAIIQPKNTPTKPERPSLLSAEPTNYPGKETSRPKTYTLRYRSRTEPLAQVLAEEIRPGSQKPDTQRVKTALETSRKVSLVALSQETDNLAKVVNLPKTDVGTKPKAETLTNQEPDLKQALKTYELLTAALAEAQMQPEQAQKQATDLVCQALPQLQLKEEFLILTGQKAREQRHQEIIEKQTIEIFFERDTTADFYREKDAQAAAEQVFNQRSDEIEFISGADIVQRMTAQPEPEEQISAILKPGQSQIDGSLKDFKSFIAQAVIKSKEEAYKLIGLAKRFFPAVRVTTRVTTELVAEEDVERVVQGRIRHQYLQSLLRRSDISKLMLNAAGKA